MSFLSGLASLLGTVGHDINQVNPFHAQTAQAPGRPLPEAPPPGLRQAQQFLQQRQPIQQLPQRRLPLVPMGQDPKNYGYPPDITYNPNPNTNIPYSTHDFSAFHTAQMLPYMGYNGQIEPTTQQVAPNSVLLNRPQPVANNIQSSLAKLLNIGR